MLVRSLVLLAVLSTACGAPPEEPPAPVTLSEHWICSYLGGATGAWHHNIYRYTDGSVFAACEVADGYYSTTNVALFRASQAGADDAGCSLVSDWDAPTYGYWDFAFNGTSSSAKYNDTGSPSNGWTVNMSCKKF